MEALVNVSLQPSVLDAAVMSYSMLKPGQEVNGTVLSVDTYGVLVTLGKNIRGLVTQFHVADVLLKTKKVRRRVLFSPDSRDAAQRLLMLALGWSDAAMWTGTRSHLAVTVGGFSDQHQGRCVGAVQGAGG